MSTQQDITRSDHLVGQTMVRCDRGGPWGFERDGQAVECVCADGITCEYHARDISEQEF